MRTKFKTSKGDSELFDIIAVVSLPFKGGYSGYSRVPGNFFDLPGNLLKNRFFRKKCWPQAQKARYMNISLRGNYYEFLIFQVVSGQDWSLGEGIFPMVCYLSSRRGLTCAVGRMIPSGKNDSHREECFPVGRMLPSGKNASQWEEFFPVGRVLSIGKNASQ